MPNKSTDKTHGIPFNSESGREASNKRKVHSGGKQSSIEANFTGKREDVSRILANSSYWFQFPKVTTDDECEDRVIKFFERCIETGELPTNEKLACALGVTYQTVRNWNDGTQGVKRQDIIRRALQALAAMDAELASENKIPQVVYIFRSKNYHGLKDQTEISVAPATDNLETYDKEALALQYAEAIPKLPTIEDDTEA